LARSKKERDTCATIVASANGLRFCHPSVRDRPVDTVRRRASDADSPGRGRATRRPRQPRARISPAPPRRTRPLGWPWP
jgi:hypothetical protein